MTSMDEILSEIVRLEAKLEKDREGWTKTKSKAKELEIAFVHIRNAYEEIKRQYASSQNEIERTRADLRIYEREGKNDSELLEIRRRELARLEDAQRINEDYRAKVDEFKERCLNASWRSENRDDGRGALAHQIEGGILAAVAGQAFLGDKRGLGKSLTSLVYCDLKEAKRVIAISPADTMNNYIQEVQIWTPHRSPIKLGKMPRAARDFVISSIASQPEFLLLINFEAWRKDPTYIDDLIKLQADTLIIDEAHNAKEQKSVAADGIRRLRFGGNICPMCDNPDIKGFKADYSLEFNPEWECRNCRWKDNWQKFCSIKNVLPMTGTGILNRPGELYPHLHLIDPENFSKERKFLVDFCVHHGGSKWGWAYGGQKALIEKIGPRYIARDRTSAGIVIPPPARVKHTITMDELQENYPAQFRAYRQVRDYAQVILDPDREIVMAMPNKITALLRLRQVLVWPGALEIKWKDDNEEEHRIQLEVFESVKLDKAEKLIRELIDEGERFALFSQFKPGLHELQRRLGSRVAIMDGSTTEANRNAIRLDFDPKTVSESPRWDGVLCNYRTGGVGLNLNSARHAILLDHEWNEGKEDQAEGRVEGRLGQTWQASIHTISVEKSVDTWMEDMIAYKKELTDGFNSEVDVYRNAYDALLKGDM